MKSWLALFVAPSVVLGAQSVLYAWVTPACSSQAQLQLHLTAAVALAIVVVLGVAALGESSLHGGGSAGADSDEVHATARRRFLADMAAGVAALSALVILGMWLALWVLTPCEL